MRLLPDGFDSVDELCADDQLGQLVVSVEAAPTVLCRLGEFEDHGERRLVGEASLGSHGPVRSAPWPVRSRTRGARTATGPMPVMISRSGRWPWRTSRRRPSSVRASEWPSRNPATSASTARASRDRAPLRSTSVNGSENVDGWESFKTVLSLTAYHSFVGEVEARSPPRYAALTLHPVTNFWP